ncbi:MAG: Kiwa anti-phage protein KwaB-like domain-containing protein [Candidatus Woesearchaeota archaeon]
MVEFNQETVFQGTEQLLLGNLSATLIFITREKSEERTNYNFKKVLLNQEVQENLRKSFLGKVKRIKKSIHKINFEKYSPTNTSECIKYVSDQEIEQKLLKLNKDEIETIRGNELNSEFFENLWGYLAIFENNNSASLRIFKRYTPGNILRKSLLNALIIKDGTFTKLDEDIFKMDYKIHCFLFGGFVIIFAKRAFEELFELEDKFMKESKEVLDEINKKEVKITDWDDFKEKCCDNINMMRKLSNIKAKGYYHSITFVKVKKMKKDYKLRFKIDEQNKTIIYKEYKDIWDILALFDDDLLKSELTQKKYEVSSKKER